MTLDVSYQSFTKGVLIEVVLPTKNFCGKQDKLMESFNERKGYNVF